MGREYRWEADSDIQTLRDNEIKIITMLKEAMSHFTDETFSGYCNRNQMGDLGHTVD